MIHVAFPVLTSLFRSISSRGVSQSTFRSTKELRPRAPMEIYVLHRKAGCFQSKSRTSCSVYPASSSSILRSSRRLLSHFIQNHAEVATIRIMLAAPRLRPLPMWKSGASQER